MAIWQFEMTGLKVLAHDDYGWPITQLDDLVMEIEEGNILVLKKIADDVAKERFPEYYTIKINRVDRVDIKTSKNYWPNDPRDLAYRLNSAQKETLEQIKSKIYEDAMGDSKPLELMDLLTWLKSGDS